MVETPQISYVNIRIDYDITSGINLVLWRSG